MGSGEEPGSEGRKLIMVDEGIAPETEQVSDDRADQAEWITLRIPRHAPGRVEDLTWAEALDLARQLIDQTAPAGSSA